MTSFVIAGVVGLWRPGAMTRSVWRAGHRGVRVKQQQLRQWYHTLDRLLAHKAQIEHGLFARLRNLFSLQVDMVLYDLTSSYFGAPGKAWRFQRVKFPHRQGGSHPTGNRALGLWR